MRPSRFIETLPDQDDFPKGWILTKLCDGLIINVQTGFACGKNSRDHQGIPHLRPMNVTDKGQIDLNDLKFVPVSECSRSRNNSSMKAMYLFNNTNSPALVGKTAVYNLPEPRAFSNHITRLRCNKDIIKPVFCAMVLHQKWREGYFKSVCNNHVSQSSIRTASLVGYTNITATARRTAADRRSCRDDPCARERSPREAEPGNGDDETVPAGGACSGV